MVRVRFTDLDGPGARGGCGRALRHLRPARIDHLNGVLFVDYLSKLEHDRVLRSIPRPPARGGFGPMPLRLILIGTPEFAVPTLLELVAHDHEIVAIYTRVAGPPVAA